MRTEWNQRLTDGLMYQWQCCGFCIDPVVKRRLSVKGKLSIYRSIYFLTLTCVNKLWTVTERTRVWTPAAETSFL